MPSPSPAAAKPPPPPPPQLRPQPRPSPSPLLPLALMLLLGLALSAAPARAERTFDSGPQRVALIELFTSQGCNSCPPAERWLGELRGDPRLWRELVPVAFHVDYWDGLGWRDQFASPAFSQRQRQYYREGAVGTVYTPGFVVDGREWRGWFRAGDLPAPRPAAGRLRLGVDGVDVAARFDGAAAGETLQLHLAVLGVGIRAEIGAGENSGRTLGQDFTVLGHRVLAAADGRWSGQLPTFAAPAGARLALAAWVSRDGLQAPLQAVGGWLPD